MTYKYTALVNAGKLKYESFDAFYRASNTLTLCDGANSCKYSGWLAKEVARLFSEKLVALRDSNWNRADIISKIIFEIHDTYMQDRDNGATTLLSLNIQDDFYELISVGDSYGQVYTYTTEGIWKRYYSIPRDIDMKGNPWQLIGSDILESIHYRRITREQVACVLLMSDGIGNFIHETEIERILNSKYSNSPNIEELAEYLLKISEKRGSKDDMSICVTIIEKVNEK